jgi:hypothetical protein
MPSKLGFATRDDIQSRRSSFLHAVTRGESFTGAGKVPAFTMRHSVEEENGTIPGTSCD